MTRLLRRKRKDDQLECRLLSRRWWQSDRCGESERCAEVKRNFYSQPPVRQDPPYPHLEHPLAFRLSPAAASRYTT